MPPPIQTCLKLLVLLFALSSPAAGQGGFEFLTAKAGEYNLWALRLMEVTEVVDSIESMSGNTLTDPGQDFDAILAAGVPYVVELNGGVNDGKVLDIVSFSGDTLTVAETLPVDTPVPYRIRPLKRLSEVVGPAHVTGFLEVADFNPDSGDLILLPAGEGLFDAYYHSSHPSLPGFINADSGEAEDPVLLYTEAFFYLRRGVVDASLFVVGEVKDWNTLVRIEDKFSYVGPANPVATLGNQSLDASLQSGTEATADIVWLQDVSNGGYKRYFHSDGTAPLGAGWRQAGADPGEEDVDRASVFIDAGMIIQRRGPLPADVLLVPGFSP